MMWKQVRGRDRSSRRGVHIEANWVQHPCWGDLGAEGEGSTWDLGEVAEVKALSHVTLPVNMFFSVRVTPQAPGLKSACGAGAVALLLELSLGAWLKSQLLCFCSSSLPMPLGRQQRMG